MLGSNAVTSLILPPPPFMGCSSPAGTRLPSLIRTVISLAESKSSETVFFHRSISLGPRPTVKGVVGGCEGAAGIVDAAADIIGELRNRTPGIITDKTRRIATIRRRTGKVFREREEKEAAAEST